MTNFVQFAHGLLLDVENFGRRHSQPVASFNPTEEDVPGAADASAAPVVETPITYNNVPTDVAKNAPLDADKGTAQEQEGNFEHTPATYVDHNVKPAHSPEEEAANLASAGDVRDLTDTPNAPLDSNDHSSKASTGVAATDQKVADDKAAEEAQS